MWRTRPVYRPSRCWSGSYPDSVTGCLPNVAPDGWVGPWWMGNDAGLAMLCDDGTVLDDDSGDPLIIRASVLLQPANYEQALTASFGVALPMVAQDPDVGMFVRDAQMGATTIGDLGQTFYYANWRGDARLGHNPGGFAIGTSGIGHHAALHGTLVDVVVNGYAVQHEVVPVLLGSAP